MQQQQQGPGRPPPSEPPTLPLPSLWRLLVAGAVIVGFLWFIYDYQRQIDEAEARRLLDSPPAATTPTPPPAR